MGLATYESLMLALMTLTVSCVGSKRTPFECTVGDYTYGTQPAGELKTSVTQIFQVISENNTYVTTPNFPANYNDKMWLWVSVRPPDKLSRVSIIFESFDVEYSPDCTADSILILGTDNPHLICGSTILSPVVSLGNIVEIFFKSDSKTARAGFAAFVQFLDPDLEHRTPAPGICESVYVVPNTTEYFTSPNGGNSYYRSIQCGYIIHTDVWKTIELSFKWFGLENCASRADNEDFNSLMSSYDVPDVILGIEHEIDVASCPCDSLQVFDGVDENAPNLTDRLCGWDKDIGAVSSTGNVMYLYLETDNDVRVGGFAARVRAT